MNSWRSAGDVGLWAETEEPHAFERTTRETLSVRSRRCREKRDTNQESETEPVSLKPVAKSSPDDISPQFDLDPFATKEQILELARRQGWRIR
jgi:hypothetical protein